MGQQYQGLAGRGEESAFVQWEVTEGFPKGQKAGKSSTEFFRKEASEDLIRTDQ
jgi:hypothetical protein